MKAAVRFMGRVYLVVKGALCAPTRSDWKAGPTRSGWKANPVCSEMAGGDGWESSCAYTPPPPPPPRKKEKWKDREIDIEILCKKEKERDCSKQRK